MCNRRTFHRRSTAALALTLLVTALGSVHAAKPGGGGGGGGTTPPPPPGKIYYSLAGLTSEMNGDGTGKSLLFTKPQDALYLVPSLGSYGGQRWWLAGRNTAPSLQDLFATKDGITWIQLTASGFRDNGDGTETHVKFLPYEYRPSWSNDGLDAFCSVRALRWIQDQATGTRRDMQAVIYRLNVSAAALETFVAGVNDPLLFDGDAGVTAVLSIPQQPGLQVQEHHWSPDGNKLVFKSWNFHVENGPDLWMVDVSDLSHGPVDGTLALKLFDDGNTFGVNGTPQWSRHPNVADQRIAFGCAGQIYTVAHDGSNLVNVTAGSQPFWSPDSKFLTYRLYTQKGFNYYYNAARVPATGGSVVNLTSDIDRTIAKEVWGWGD